MDSIPNSYQDSYWAKLASTAEKQAGLPVGLLNSVVSHGERSNNNQVSKAGARTPFQIIPATRKAILDKYGIDTYLNPENAAEGAALLLKESLDRNDGDIAAAVAEYHGGTNKKNWGAKTNAYVNRVLNGHDHYRVQALSDDFADWLAQNPAERNPVDDGASLKMPGQAATSPDISTISAGFDDWVKQQEANPPQEDLGFFGGIKESVTGERRSTPTTESLPDWAGMPELSDFSVAGAKTALGTIVAQPDEIVQIIKANYPNADVRQDEKGNFVIRSSIDGKEYAIKPGFSLSDIPRAIAGIAAFTPAARVGGIAKGALAAAGTQAAIEGTQAATGGTFDPANVAITGAVAGAIPPLISGVKAFGSALASPAKAALSKLTGITPQVETALASQEAAAGNQAVQGANVQAPVAAAPVAAAPVATPPVGSAASPLVEVVPLPLKESAKIARKAAEGGMGSKTAIENLVEQAAPNKKTLEAAKRLGIEDHLQPDHVTTNQVYREMSQAAKSLPGSVSRAEEIEGLTQIARRADELINELGGTHDSSTLSQRVKQGLQKTQEDLDKKAEEYYAQLRKAIPANREKPVPHNPFKGVGGGGSGLTKEEEYVNKLMRPENTLTFVHSKAKELGGADKLSRLEKSVLSRLSGDPSYALIDRVRKDVGAATISRGPFKDENTGLAKKIYSAITKDQERIANYYGMGELFNKAKATVELRKSIENDLTSLFSKDISGSLVGGLDRAVKLLDRGDTSQFINMIKAIPEDMRKDVVASGLASAFSKSKKTISFNEYANWYEGVLKNKQAHSALMINLPQQARKRLSDLYRVSRDISKASKERITTGRIQASKEAFEGGETLLAKAYDAARRRGVGVAAGGIASTLNPGLGVVVASVLSKGPKTPAIEAVDKLLVSPEFKRAILKANNGKAKEGAKELSKSRVFSNFVNRLGRPKELNDRERWILQALEADAANQPTYHNQKKRSF